MKNTFNPNFALAGSTMIFAVFAIAFMAFPQAANAQAYGGAFNNGYSYGNAFNNSYSNCQYPTVYSNGYYTCNYQATNYQPAPTYNYPPQQPPQYQQLSVTCYPNSSSVPAGTSVQWVASPMGGNGQFSYNWSGTDGLGGTGQTAYVTYQSPGTKSGSVTVYSNGQSVSASCSNFVTVMNPVVYNPPVYTNTYNYNTVPMYASSYNYTNYQHVTPLAASCVANTTQVGVGSAVTWSASATGGNGYYQYSWTGTDGIYGQGQTIAYTYNTPGTKYASATVYSNGQTITVACNSIVNVGIQQQMVQPIIQPVQYVYTQSVVQQPAKQVAKVVAQPTPVVKDTSNQQNLTAASAFSLGSIPWGWVAVLVILILFATVMYLLFNKPKM